MPKARDTNLPQHDINQGHFGEIDLSFLPDGVNVGDVVNWNGTTWVVASITADGRVKVTSADDTADFISAKIVAGPGITIEVVNPGAAETLKVSSSGGGGGGEVLMADGISNPPEPLTNEDGTDWLYEG